MENPPLVAIMPSPGMGHLNPLIELAKRLTRHHNLAVTFIIPTDGPPSKAQTTILTSLPPVISHIFLPPVNLSDLPPNTKIESRISVTILCSLPSLRHTLLTISHNLTTLVVDLFGIDAIEIARELNVLPYIFFSSTAMLLSLSLYFPRLDKEVLGEYTDLTKPVQIPGSIPVHVKDLPEPFQSRDNDVHKWLLHLTSRFGLAEGILENSFSELEPETIKFLQKIEPGRPPVYPVGPLVNEDYSQTGCEDSNKCLEWLDEKPRGNAIFVCFGSGGTLSRAQIIELALGLEMSEQRFLWVVKSPNDYISNASYFGAEICDSLDFLPKGFIERTKERGLVVPSWAPQAQILSHGSIGGFLSHCGWNSVLESVVNGVPLIAWPLYAEQRMNAILVSEEVKVALRVNVSENVGIVEREEIACVVKKLIEGEDGKKARIRMKDLKVAAVRTLGENGSSTKQIAELALKWQGRTIITKD